MGGFFDGDLLSECSEDGFGVVMHVMYEMFSNDEINIIFTRIPLISLWKVFLLPRISHDLVAEIHTCVMANYKSTIHATEN
jgi:hypothetical protein